MSTTFRPGQLYEFPPFFTRQPNEDTWKAQVEQWKNTIHAYCSTEKSWTVDPSSPVFKNPRIQREVKPDMAQEIMQYMVKSGVAKSKGPNAIYVYAKNPTDLASDLKQWSDATGHGGSVLTYYELTEGGLPGLDQFIEMDSYLLKMVVDILVKKRQVATLTENGETVAIKLAST